MPMHLQLCITLPHLILSRLDPIACAAVLITSRDDFAFLPVLRRVIFVYSPTVNRTLLHGHRILSGPMSCFVATAVRMVLCLVFLAFFLANHPAFPYILIFKNFCAT